MQLYGPYDTISFKRVKANFLCQHIRKKSIIKNFLAN